LLQNKSTKKVTSNIQTKYQAIILISVKNEVNKVIKFSIDLKCEVAL